MNSTASSRIKSTVAMNEITETILPMICPFRRFGMSAVVDVSILRLSENPIKGFLKAPFGSVDYP
jgi:hypothetical protein